MLGRHSNKLLGLTQAAASTSGVVVESRSQRLRGYLRPAAEITVRALGAGCPYANHAPTPIILTTPINYRNNNIGKSIMHFPIWLVFDYSFIFIVIYLEYRIL